MIFLCGDTHGTDYFGKVRDYFMNRDDVSKEDYLIILGDAAVCWDNGNNDEATIEALQSLPVTVLFVDGNHENYDMLNEFGVDKWNGGKVHHIRDGIIHLMRGQVFEVAGRTIFTMGGAFSYNKSELTPGLQWWEDELPTKEEIDEAWDNLKRYDFQVDYILTHAGPYEAVTELGFGLNYDEELAYARVLQQIADNVDFEEWYFGHYHVDEDVENYHCIMENVIEL